jgi:hypothetical protein
MEGLPFHDGTFVRADQIVIIAQKLVCDAMLST